jgi:galactosylceramidase
MLVERPDGKGKCLHQVVPFPATSWAPDWLPYTGVGDDQWQDCELSADVWLSPGEAGAVMGRINHVGTGYGFIPKGYFLQLGDHGRCRLVVIRGRPDRMQAAGDAEQQALIRAGKDDGEGGNKVLGSIPLQTIAPNRWHI